MKQPTIADVAKIAGVSKTTMSRFLNQDYDHMSQKTKEKITQVVKELNYHPNRHAQSLKSKVTREIGVQIADISNTYASELLKGIGNILRDNNYQMLITDSANSLELERQQLESLIRQQVDGIILQPVSRNASDYQFIKDANIPLVLVDRQVNQLLWPTVTSDNYKITKELGRLMVERKYQRVITITNPVHETSTRELRYQAIKEVASANQLIDELVELTPNLDLKDYLRNSLATSKLKTVLFTTNSMVLSQVLATLMELKIKFPQDIGICSYDGWNWTQLIGNGITTIDQDPIKIGSTSAQIIIDALNDPDSYPDLKKHIITAHLITKDSL
ncbi:LacI family DNA-binding transcriptional regulator [Lentilactobacillus senioris]|uniref:LacI family DNA-binding transcriptional regulator n=1 Tax=Lentilactobacillus senioris TaxID=931534 RepID=UPI003D2C8AD2